MLCFSLLSAVFRSPVFGYSLEMFRTLPSIPYTVVHILGGGEGSDHWAPPTATCGASPCSRGGEGSMTRGVKPTLSPPGSPLGSWAQRPGAPTAAKAAPAPPRREGWDGDRGGKGG